jgi:hypothetical protein
MLAQHINAEPDYLAIELPNGRVVRIRWEDCSAVLAAATPLQRSQAELSPSGYGIHWPLLDEDLSIRGLLRDAESRQTG